MKKISAALIVVAFFGAVLWSCTKPSKDKENSPSSSFLQKISGSAHLKCNLPRVVNGILTFDDKAHYDCYEEFLYAVVDSLDTTVSSDDILDSIETSLGYASLRADALAKFEALNSVGWANEADIPEEHFITSNLTRSMLNTDMELQIGNKIVKYINADWLVYADASDANLLNNLRSVGRNPTIEELIDLDLARQHLAITSLHSAEYSFGTVEFADGQGSYGTPVEKPTGTDVFVMSGNVYNDYHCTNPGYTNFTGFNMVKYNGFVMSPQVAFYRIEMNDGFGTYYEGTSSTGSFWSILPQHTANYPAGTWHPTVKARSLTTTTGNTWDIEHTYTVVVKGITSTCSLEPRGALGTYNITSSNVIKGKIDYSTYMVFPWTPESKVSGWTELHQKDEFGSWYRVKNRNCELCVTLEPVLKQPDDCSNYSTSYQYAQCGKDRNQHSYKMTFPGKKALQRLRGYHYVHYGPAITGTLVQTIELCPQ